MENLLRNYCYTSPFPIRANGLTQHKSSSFVDIEQPDN